MVRFDGRHSGRREPSLEASPQGQGEGAAEPLAGQAVATWNTHGSSSRQRPKLQPKSPTPPGERPPYPQGAPFLARPDARAWPASALTPRQAQHFGTSGCPVSTHRCFLKSPA